MGGDPAQHHARNEKKRRACHRQRQGAAPVPALAPIGQDHHRRLGRCIRYRRRGLGGCGQLLYPVGALPADLAHLGRRQGVRVALVARREHVYRIARHGAVHPETPPSVTAARAAAAGIALRIVHAHTTHTKRAFGYAYPPGLPVPLAPAGRHFSIAFAGAEYFFHARFFIVGKVGVLGPGAGQQGEPTAAQQPEMQAAAVGGFRGRRHWGKLFHWQVLIWVALRRTGQMQRLAVVQKQSKMRPISGRNGSRRHYPMPRTRTASCCASRSICTRRFTCLPSKSEAVSIKASMASITTFLPEAASQRPRSSGSGSKKSS